jgi:hypothetical protein
VIPLFQAIMSVPASIVSLTIRAEAASVEMAAGSGFGGYGSRSISNAQDSGQRSVGLCR